MPDAKKGDAAAMRLVGMAREKYTFLISEAGEPFAIPKAGPTVVRMLRGGRHSLRAELAHRYAVEHQTVPSQQALADALLVLEGGTLRSTPVPLHVRVATVDNVVFLDLGDDTGRAVRIRDGAWEVIEQPLDGVYFRRSPLTAPLPVPAYGGQVARLWDFVNFAEADRPLILAALIHALIEYESHVIVSIAGEQGTGKTSAARILVSLIDPSTVPIRKPPKDPEAWVTAAGGSWVVAFDNVSTIPEWFSDALCRASTGDGDARRKLYSDGDLVVFAFRRVLILTSIDVGAVRGDLADRLLAADLNAISELDRSTDKDLAAEWARAYPAVLGALLSLAAKVLDRLPGVTLARKPRMADFAWLLAALDAELGTDGLGQYRRRLTAQLADSLSDDPFIAKLTEVAVEESERPSAAWLSLCEPFAGSDEAKTWRPPKGWPANGRSATQHLHRHSPAMRRVGWVVEDLGSDNERHATVWRLKAPAVPE
jgi:hypothetical protein